MSPADNSSNSHPYNLTDEDFDFTDLVFESLRPVSLCLFIGFSIFVILGFIDRQAAPDDHVVIVATDAATALVFLTFYFALRANKVPFQFTYPLSMFYLVLVIANSLLVFWYTKDPFFLTYMLLAGVSCGAFMLSAPWLIFSFFLITISSAVVATQVLPTETVFQFSPMLIGSFVVSMLIYLVRRGHVIQSRQALRAMQMEAEERKRAEQALTHAQRLESIGKLVSGIAHDFNNLLMVILGYTDNLLASKNMTEETRKDLEAIQKAGDNAAALATKLLAFSRQQVLNLEPIDCNLLIFETKPLIEKSLPSNIELKLDLHAEHDRVEIDSLQMQQVLINLALNARDAMGTENGTLTIESDNEAFEDGTTRLVIRVKDTGAGMSKEVQERIFEPFYTTKPSGEGTGLGLAMVHGIVNQIGGDISVTTELGKGSSFNISLACSDVEQVPRSEPELPEPMPIKLNEAVVMLVDDELGVRTILTRILEESVKNVITASSAEEALTFAKRSDFDVVVTDVMMPGLSGPELVRELREQGLFQPAILMSGYANEELEADNQNLRLLNKPFRGEQLLEALQEALDSARIIAPKRWSQQDAS